MDAPFLGPNRSHIKNHSYVPEFQNNVPYDRRECSLYLGPGASSLLSAGSPPLLRNLPPKIVGVYSTVCPRSSDSFYIVTYYINWVPTSWTSSIVHLISCSSLRKNTDCKDTDYWGKNDSVNIFEEFLCLSIY